MIVLLKAQLLSCAEAGRGAGLLGQTCLAWTRCWEWPFWRCLRVSIWQVASGIEPWSKNSGWGPIGKLFKGPGDCHHKHHRFPHL